ncbi:hypothetical protein PCASD_16405 [Puccinia coronata f. sp. avenae]|uniref:Lethal giant larvae (Lgl)-like C-terminal domain-containing protein n=1 Tax=Puccinia coronata f. sp. avenae TaxID=200324 RepID=A0A2N5SUJ5_9BASI|nr:hypothetical protein PCASD_16405 [Puccinia coronata f. sp. avenae]
MCTSGDQAKAHGGVLYALTDIGFLAIAHRQEEWIKIVDLRKSKLLFNDVIRNESKSKEKLRKIQSAVYTGPSLAQKRIRPLFLDL